MMKVHICSTLEFSSTWLTDSALLLVLFAGVKVEIWFGICDKVTLRTTVREAKMPCFHVLSQQSLSCCLVVTLVTWILYLHMDSIFVNFYTALLCCFVRTLVTGPPLLLME